MSQEVLDPLRDQEFDLDALESALRQVLRTAGTRSEDGRISAYPDARTLRYYQSSGLISRPLRYEARQAVYGFRHLLEAAAVKLLQAEGASLAQAQRALAGATESELESTLRDALAEAAESQRSALGLVSTSNPRQPPTASVASASLMAVELRPGLQVIVDPRQIDDPARVLDVLARALEAGVGNRGGGT